MNLLFGVMLPFLGTTLGAACVFGIQKELNLSLQKMLLGFASGVMVAASVWSLLIPAMDMSVAMGKLAFFPAAFGILLGIAFLILMDRIISHIHINQNIPESPRNRFKKTMKLLLAVTLHNIPEGMAVGIVFAGMLNENSQITFAGAMALAFGIAIQNFPEGAIVSVPFKSAGNSKGKSFLFGMLSGIVEPIAAMFTILSAGVIEPILPYILSFAAGAMLYVVVEELIPEASEGEHSNLGTIGFMLGFLIMMILDTCYS